jgi:predicted deacetylase
MRSIEPPRRLCVSIHDVAPATLPQCALLLDAVAAVADIPITLLVVPAYHGVADTVPAYDRQLERRLARGDELTLHGYTHLDQGPPARSWREHYARHIYTDSEGEFAALPEEEAARRLALGIQWFARRGWPLHGFVAPAWLLGPGGWQALRQLPFVYTTTWRRFYLLPGGQSLQAPSLVYSSRNAWGRTMSRQAVTWTSLMQRDAPLVRLSLHPRDALYPATVSHFQKLLERLLERRQAATKAAFALSWRALTAQASPREISA